MELAQAIMALSPRFKTKVFTCTPLCTVTGTVDQFTISVAAVVAGRRDPILEIRVGQTIDGLGTSGFASVGTVISVNRVTRVVTMSSVNIDNFTSTPAVFGYSNTFTVPSDVYVLWASYCGAGTAGAGGYSGVGAGGGGGAASCTFEDVEIPVYPGQVIKITVGAPIAGGLVGAQAGVSSSAGSPTDPRTSILANDGLVDWAGTGNILSAIDYSSDAGLIVPIYMPTGRANLNGTGKAGIGTATVGGVGAMGAPEYGILGTAAGGLAGGVGGSAGVNASNGLSALQTRGKYYSSGGSGGGGAGPSSSSPGEGGSDLMHTDGYTTVGSGAGGNGGSSRYGKGGVATLTIGGDARGYGSGSAGGATGYVAGASAPGICILKWLR